MDIEQRLREMYEKWRHANLDVATVCRDAAEEIRVLRIQQSTQSMLDPNCSVGGWGKGKDE